MFTWRAFNCGKSDANKLRNTNDFTTGILGTVWDENDNEEEVDADEGSVDDDWNDVDADVVDVIGGEVWFCVTLTRKSNWL